MEATVLESGLNLQALITLVTGLGKQASGGNAYASLSTVANASVTRHMDRHDGNATVPIDGRFFHEFKGKDFIIELVKNGSNVKFFKN